MRNKTIFCLVIIFLLLSNGLIFGQPISNIGQINYSNNNMIPHPRTNGDSKIMNLDYSVFNGNETEVTVTNTSGFYSVVVRVMLKPQILYTPPYTIDDGYVEYEDEYLGFLLYLTPNDSWKGLLSNVNTNNSQLYSTDDSIRASIDSWASPQNPVSIAFFSDNNTVEGHIDIYGAVSTNQITDRDTLADTYPINEYLFRSPVDSYEQIPLILTASTIIRPQSPTGLSVQSGSRSAALYWNEQFSNIQYYIYRSDSENGFYVNVSPDLHYELTLKDGNLFQTFTDDNLINGIEYWYRVTSVDADGREGLPSGSVRVTPTPLEGGDFRIEVLEPSAMVGVGDSTALHLTVYGEDGFTEPVDLSATSPDLPGQVTKQLSTDPVIPTGVTALSLDVPYSTAPGSYLIEITGISTNRSHKVTVPVRIVKPGTGESVISAAPISSKVRFGEKASIVGQLIPWQSAGTILSVLIQAPDDPEWQSYPITLLDNSEFRFDFTPSKIGPYRIKSKWIGNYSFSGAESEIAEFKVTKGESQIYCTTSTPDPEPGETISIQIELTPPLEGEPLYFEVLKPGSEIPDPIDGLTTQTGGKRQLTYDLEPNLPGIWQLKAGWAGNAEHSGAISLPLVLYPGIEVGQALIVAGGGVENNSLWPAIEYLSNRFYQVLKTRRFTHDQIYYITDATHNYDLDGDGTDDIIVDDNSPTAADLQTHIENLYAGQPKVGENRPLIIYLADHGGVGQFKINRGEYLNASDLDQWLDALQARTGCLTVVIAEACYSGTFIDQLQPTDNQQRILISSSNDGLSNYDQNGVLSFSRFLFDRISQGDNLKNCFYKARKETSEHYLFARQNPRIDGDLLAHEFYFGGTYLTGDIMPEIIDATPNQVIEAGQFSLFAEVTDIEGINTVWGSIVPPGFEPSTSAGDFETPVYDFDRVDLADPDFDSRFEGNYEFTYNGTYIVTIFASDTGGNVVSREVRLTVENGMDMIVKGDLNDDTKTNLADAIIALKALTGETSSLRSDYVGSGADVNGDDRVGTQEAAYILKVVATP